MKPKIEGPLRNLKTAIADIVATNTRVDQAQRDVAQLRKNAQSARASMENSLAGSTEGANTNEPLLKYRKSLESIDIAEARLTGLQRSVLEYAAKVRESKEAVEVAMGLLMEEVLAALTAEYDAATESYRQAARKCIGTGSAFGIRFFDLESHVLPSLTGKLEDRIPIVSVVNIHGSLQPVSWPEAPQALADLRDILKQAEQLLSQIPWPREEPIVSAPIESSGCHSWQAAEPMPFADY